MKKWFIVLVFLSLISGVLALGGENVETSFFDEVSLFFNKVLEVNAKQYVYNI
jgi:hypothetical protein